MSVHIKTFPNSDFEENFYILWRDDAQKNQEGKIPALLIDPGIDPRRGIAFLRENNLTPESVLITHGHCDHIAGVIPLRAAYPEIQVLISEIDRPKMTNPHGNLSANFGLPVNVGDADASIADGEIITAASLSLKASLLPGHSEGHMIFELLDTEPKAVFVGDVIFSGSIGRTDFPGGSMSTLIRGIQEKILTLPDQTTLYPGHGPTTTPQQERENNPWL